MILVHQCTQGFLHPRKIALISALHRNSTNSLKQAKEILLSYTLQRRLNSKSDMLKEISILLVLLYHD